MKTNAMLLAILLFGMSLAGCVSQTDGVADINVANEPLQVTLSDEQMDHLVNSTYNTITNVNLQYVVLEISNINDTHHAILGTQFLNVGQFDAPTGYRYTVIQVNDFVKERSSENQANTNNASNDTNEESSQNQEEWIKPDYSNIKFYSFCADFPKTQSNEISTLSTLPSQDCRVEVGFQAGVMGSPIFGSTWLNFEQTKEMYSDVYIEVVVLIEPIIPMS